MNIKKESDKMIPNWIKRLSGHYIEWEDWNRLIQKKEYVEFLSKTTDDSCNHLLSKGK